MSNQSSPFPEPAKYGFAGRMASIFIDSKLTPIVVAASLLLGFFSILMLPREEEPQIKVPMIDVMLAMPGATAEEVESRVSSPVERLLWDRRHKRRCGGRSGGRRFGAVVAAAATPGGENADAGNGECGY